MTRGFHYSKWPEASTAWSVQSLYCSNCTEVSTIANVQRSLFVASPQASPVASVQRSLLHKVYSLYCSKCPEVSTAASVQSSLWGLFCSKCPEVSTVGQCPKISTVPCVQDSTVTSVQKSLLQPVQCPEDSTVARWPEVCPEVFTGANPEISYVAFLQRFQLLLVCIKFGCCSEISTVESMQMFLQQHINTGESDQRSLL